VEKLTGEKVDSDFRLIVKYVNSAADLAEQLERDLKKSDKISMATTQRLIKFKQAALDAASLLSKFVDSEDKYNN
jgi:hypothetical protein